MHFPGIESFDFYINFSKAKVTNLAILSYVLRNNMGNDIFLKKYFFTVIVKNGSCTLFGQTSHCGGGGGNPLLATVRRLEMTKIKLSYKTLGLGITIKYS